MAFVYSTKAHANIIDVNASEALSMPGVRDFICHKDVPGPNLWGPAIHDEEVFASSTVRMFENTPMQYTEIFIAKKFC